MLHHCGAEMRVVRDTSIVSGARYCCPYCDGAALHRAAVLRRVEERLLLGDRLRVACRRIADEDGVSVESVEMAYRRWIRR